MEEVEGPFDRGRWTEVVTTRHSLYVGTYSSSGDQTSFYRGISPRTVSGILETHTM